jgi:hypothetical protein
MQTDTQNTHTLPAVMPHMKATVMVKCLSVVIATWTSYALYHAVWTELFYGVAIDVDLYTRMLTIEIILVGVVLLAVVGQYACLGKAYNVGSYISLFSTSAAAIVGISSLLVLLYNPGSIHETLDTQYTADMYTPLTSLHARLAGLNVSATGTLLFGEDTTIGTGLDLLDGLPHGPLMYIFLSSLFTIAYTAPLVLLQCYKRTSAYGDSRNGVYGDHNGKDDKQPMCCFQWFPVWPAVATVQIAIAGLVLYSWMMPTLGLMETVMILAMVCGIIVSLIAIYTVGKRTYYGGCVCVRGFNSTFESVEVYYRDATLHLLMAVAIANVAQAFTATLAYDREAHSGTAAAIYIGCVDALDDVNAPAHSDCVVLVSTVLSLTARSLLVFYLIAILILRTVELTQICRNRVVKHDDEEVTDKCKVCHTKFEVSIDTTITGDRDKKEIPTKRQWNTRAPRSMFASQSKVAYTAVELVEPPPSNGWMVATASVTQVGSCADGG